VTACPIESLYNYITLFWKGFQVFS